MRFVPVYFCFGNRAIFETNGGKALEFSPISFAEMFFENGEIADLVTYRDRLDVSDFADDLEGLHGCKAYFKRFRGVGLTDLPLNGVARDAKW